MIALCAVIPASMVLAQETSQLDTDAQKFSYAVGNRIGQQLSQQFSGQPGIDLESMLEGLSDVLVGGIARLSEEEIVQVIQDVQQKQLADAESESLAKAEITQTFLEENQAREGVVVTDSGLQYLVLESGDPAGMSPTPADTVVVHYHGTLVDGTVFDSSYNRGEPATFSLQSIIPGWIEVLQLMRPGDKWSIVLPPELAYGERGAGQSIGPNEVLKFDIELLEVRPSGN